MSQSQGTGSQAKRKSYLPPKDFAEGIQAKNVKKKYESINQTITENEKELINDNTPRSLSEMIITIDKMQSHVSRPSEFSEDLKSFKKLSFIAVEQGNQITLTDTAYNLASVYRNLLQKYPTRNPNRFDIAQLGDIFIRKSLIAPAMNLPTLYGLDDFHVKPRQKRMTQSQAKTGPIAEQVKVGFKATNENAHSLTERGRKFFKEIATSGSRSLAETICSENGFDSLIQRAFELAHLVRDGRVAVGVENNEIITKKSGEGGKDIDGKGRKKCVLHIRYKDYENLVRQISNSKSHMSTDISLEDFL